MCSFGGLAPVDLLLAALADEAKNLVAIMTADRGNLGGTQARSALGANPIEAGPDQTWWKETIARRVLRNSDRDFVWTDDDLERSSGNRSNGNSN